ncbi:MAG TPA: Gfo/Idh/MocA family oxidoreductase [Candidatus Fournierella merdigallinarum]|nr:Gfo/Idh/MocA family oxidoreductase [Candidatus Fournierella merdigallinarum]
MIKIGLIGCGQIAKLRHAPEYAAHPECEIAGVFDLNEEKARALADCYGARTYASAQELLASDIDAVSICAANAAHCRYTLMALRAMKNVLCEKPMAMSLEECGAMVETARQTDRVLMIAQNQRLNQAHQLVRSLVAQGEIGRLLAFQLTFGHSGPENWTGQPDPWFFRKNSAGLGALGDLGVHKIDLLRYLTGDEVSQVAAMTGTLDKRLADGSPADVEDNACLLLRMCSGAVGTIRASWTFYGQEDNSTVLYGTRGSIHVYTDPARAVVVRNRDGTERAFTERNMATNAQQLEGKGENTGVIDAFIRAILSGGPSCADGEDVLKTMRVVFAAEQAAREQKTIVLTPAAQAGRPAL